MGYVSSQDGTVKVSGSKFMQRSTLPIPSAMTSHDLPNHEIPHRFLGKTAKGAGWLDPFSWHSHSSSVTWTMIWIVESLVCAKHHFFGASYDHRRIAYPFKLQELQEPESHSVRSLFPKFHTLAIGAGQDHFRHDRTMSSARRFPCCYFRMWPHTVPVVVKWCVELPKILVDEYATLEPSLKWPSCVVLFSNFSFFECIETSLRIRSERIKVNCQGSVLTICDVLHLPYQHSSVFPS